MTRRDTFDDEEGEVNTKVSASPLPSGQRKRREIYKCPHTDKKHYAKNMCHNCYHRMGKTKMAHACGHPHKSHYSNGMCQNCYLAKYYIKRKNKMEQKAKEKAAAATAVKEADATEEETTNAQSMLGKRASSTDELTAEMVNTAQ